MRQALANAAWGTISNRPMEVLGVMLKDWQVTLLVWQAMQ